MKLKLTSALLHSAIKTASTLAPPRDENVSLESDGSKLFLHSASDVARCTINIPCEVSGKNIFGISLATLRDATKGRDALHLVFEQSVLKVKAKGYDADLPTTDALQLDALDPLKDKVILKLTADQASWLKQAVQAVSLKPTVVLTSYMPVSIKLTDKGAFVACYDDSHMAFINSKEITGDIDVTLPLDTFNSVLSVFSTAAFKLEVSFASLIVSNKLSSVNLNLPEVPKGTPTAAEVLMKAKEALKMDGSTLTFAKADMLAFLDNARAVSTKERTEVAVKSQDKTLLVSVTTSNGSCKTQIPVTGKTKAFKIDFEHFDEAIRKCSDTVEMKVVADAFVSVKASKTYLIVGLNQD